MSLSHLPSLHNLPAPVSSFVGRDAATIELLDRVRHTTLLTLTGVGGAGKTRLAVESARQLLADFPDGVYLVELAGLSDPSAILPAVAAALGVQEDAGGTLADQLAAALRRGRRLIVLDNCEHMTAACAATAAWLLRCGPELHLLATSRERLGLPGEARQEVEPLAVPEKHDEQALDRLGAVESVRLFVQRTQDRRPDFALAPANAAAVGRICRLLDGLPLALELAAAVAASLPVEVIAARLEADERFLLLRGGRRTADARQQSLEALIDWSYNLLNPSEQALFRRLAVFRGGWTLGAAEVVGGFDPIAPGDVLGLLLRLVEKSLVQVADYAQGRYRMLETLRAYGLKQLAGPEGVESRHADEAAVTRQRHVDYFVALGEQAEPALRGPEQRKWLDRLDAERDNLRAVLDGSAQAADAAAGLRLAGAIWWYWRRRGLYSEGSALLARVLEAMPPSFQGRSLAKARHAAGTLALLQGRYDAARSMLLDAVPIWKALGDNLGLGRTLSNLADISFELGDYAAAESLNLECLALKRATGDRWGEANTLGRLGYIARARGDIPIAESSLAAGLTLFRDLGDEAAVAKYVIDVAECRRLQGDVAGARRMLAEALDLSRRVQDLPNGREALIHLAHLALSTRDVDQAQRYLTELKATDHLASGPQRRGETLHLAGLLAMEAGDAVRAAQLLEESLALERAAGHRRAIGDALAGLALVGILSGRPNQAAEHLALCLTSRQALGHWLLTMEGLEIGVLWALAQDDRNAAARLLAFTSRLRAEKGVARMPFMQHALDSASGSGGLLDQAPGTAGTPDAPPPLHTMEDAVAFAIAMASSSVAD